MKQKLVIMDIFRSPWKANPISDPIISLSNSSWSDQKQTCADRYCTDSLRKNLFSMEQQENISNSAANIRVGATEQRNKKYRGMLAKTCIHDSQSKVLTQNHNTMLGKYISKLTHRAGYLLGEEQQGEQEILARARTFPKQAFRILNAPHLKDDFYTNLLDWSTDDLVSVVLDNAAYIWSSKESETEKLVEGFISSVKWGKGLILGEETGRMRVIDVEKKKQIAKHRNHVGRIGTMDSIGNLIVSGSKDCNVLIWDVRSRQTVNKWQPHKQQICGVKWSFDGNMIASGGNDNVVSVYDMRASKVIYRFSEHTAAVKALAWSPHQHYILSTGGGSTDKCIRVWNLYEGKCTKKVDTGSQVCNMTYSINSNQLVSTHGYSMNAINIWDGKNIQKLGTLRGHSYRVLYLARSPDGQSIVTGSGDQTLRFWKIFPTSTGLYSKSSLLEARNTNLR